jgi:hypothetical protein
MKKSNIVLTIAATIGLIWTILICWFYADSINRYRNGKELIFARSDKQYLESQKKIFPITSKEVIISGDGTTVVDISQGKELSVIANKKVISCTWSDLGNDRSKITLGKLYDYNETVRITIPGIKMLSIDNCAEVRINSFNRKDLNITCRRAYTFSIDSCRNQPDAEIWVKENNRIDTLIACIQGAYRLKLDTIGKMINQLRVSNSVQIITSGNLYKYFNKQSN